MESEKKLQTDSFLDACLPGTGTQIMSLKDQILRFNKQLDEARSILLLGETGVGKTYIAEVIAKHRWYLDRSFPKDEQGKKLKGKEIEMIKSMYVETRGEKIFEEARDPYAELSIPSLEGDLAMSFLFGHKAGAFTGAKADHEGFLCKKNIKDVLLDEIGYASKDMQRKLLQVLQSGTFYSLGSTKKRKVHVRLILATNQILESLVKEGKFHEDLLWRITDHVIYIPPLRERMSEIVPICENIQYILNKKHRWSSSGEDYFYLKDSDLRWAESYQWPGNIRELEKTIKRWFFYQGEKSLQQACEDVKPFIPQKNEGALLSLDELKIKSHFLKLIDEAYIAKTRMETPDKEVEKILSDARRKIEEILSECITNTGRNSISDLNKLFGNASGESIRSWKSKKKKK